MNRDEKATHWKGRTDNIEFNYFESGFNACKDDFESRTCDNCKHRNDADKYFFCNKINISFDIGGCVDYFERKQS